MAVPEDEGFSRGAASVQTRGVKKKKEKKYGGTEENHQGGRTTVKQCSNIVPAKRKEGVGRVKRGKTVQPL